MKTYKITYSSEITVEVEAKNSDSAFKKAEKATLKAADKLKIFIKPIGPLNIEEV